MKGFLRCLLTNADVVEALAIMENVKPNVQNAMEQEYNLELSIL